MKQYNVTTIDGVATVYAENLHNAWEQATAIFSDRSYYVNNYRIHKSFHQSCYYIRNYKILNWI